MQFNSIEFMIFFPVVLAVYFVIPRKIRMYWLLVASYYFYMSWNAKYAVLIGISTLTTYLSGILISKIGDDPKRTRKKFVTASCIVINIGILAVFKYGNFLMGSIDSLLRLMHITPVEHRFDLLLPVGISFYTFQAVGYVIDVYKGEVEAEKNIFRYALFVSFFPQLVAGPIERAKNLITQFRDIENINLWNLRRITSGAILMTWGLFMKMVIADRAGIIVDTVFDGYRMYGSTELIVAAILFTIQLYCDFASYSMIAIGAARILGIQLMENFAAPFLAKSVSEFWSRWHISLTQWFRSYIYIPLGGNRKGPLRKRINTMIVFLISGLWHGADWSFVVWGGINGAYIVISDIFKDTRAKIVQKYNINISCFSHRLIKAVGTSLMLVFSMIFFRAPSISDALGFIRRIFIRPTPWVIFNDELFNLGLDQREFGILIFSLVILLLIDLIRYRKNIRIDEFLFSQNLWFEWAFIIMLILMIFIVGEYGSAFDAQQFIYFQF